MKRYLFTRLLEAAFSIWGVLTIVFFVVRLNGDPAQLLMPMGSTESQLMEFRVATGLDQPLIVQYGKYLGQVLEGNFGESFQQLQPAFHVVLERMPATIELAGTALIFGVLLGGLMGFIAAKYRGTVIEFVAMLLALLGQAAPIFWMGLILILTFAVNHGWVPTGGRGGISHLILPALTLATFTASSIARLLRSRMIEIMREDYVRTAVAKGLRPRIVYVRHIMRNALIPVVTMIGILSGELLGGAVIAETIFAWPGVGRVIIQAVETNDFPVVQAGVALIAIIYVLINLAVDIAYGFLDPRIRISK